jgi:Osmosensitive K+ channel histidine kinase
LKFTKTSHISLFKQFVLNGLLVLAVAGICYYFNNLIDNKIVALILLMTVSLSAMVFNIWPVLVGATLSAFIWNFFFIQPLFTFHIISFSFSRFLLFTSMKLKISSRL